MTVSNESRILSKEDLQSLSLWVSKLKKFNHLNKKDRIKKAKGTLKLEYDVIGTGSNRIVYKINNRFVLKVATSLIGLENNDIEFEVFNQCPDHLRKHFCPVKERGEGWIIMKLMTTTVPLNEDSERDRRTLESKFKSCGIYPKDLKWGNLALTRSNEIAVFDYGNFSIPSRGIKYEKDFKSIIIKGVPGAQVEVVQNPTAHRLIGKGLQGAVFRLTSDRCVKIYARKEDKEKESKALNALQGSSIVPKVYETGTNYIIMDYINGPTLEAFLNSKGSISPDFIRQLVLIIHEMKRANFTRTDVNLSHILIDTDKKLKVIDLVNSYTKKRDCPRALLKGLDKLGLLSPFLKQVKKMDYQSYVRWKTDEKLLSYLKNKNNQSK